MARFYKCTFLGPQTSLSVHGQHFRAGCARYLTYAELPLSRMELRGLRIEVEQVEDEARPEDDRADVVVGGTAIVWDGSSRVKLTDYGTFIKGQPRRDLTADAAARLLTKQGFKRV